MSNSINDGVGYLLTGAGLLKHPSLRAFVIVPLLINIMIFGTLIALTVGEVRDLMESWMAAIPTWLSFLSWIIWPLVVISIAMISGYLFTAIAILIASPFNALLAEKAEELITGEPADGLEGIAGALMSFPRSIVRELAKFLYYLPLLLAVLLLSLIPPLSPFAPFLWFLLGAWMMAVQYVDYPMDNHLLSFKQVKQALRARRTSSLGFGGLVALASGIPIVNFFVVPAAVVGATVFWCEEIRGQTPP
ncbi:sulfate transporter CysZ [Halieaceae bacterium IMCC14734]|uniref:Sulfate transporter CysZ n=1 Tax=Candidatus Litorirhabdus singularis TaxID=2518993 RepID=A0ABT3TJL3_9GAMM|nr:sulfate transporter CysZ [Candidatus Litorirhabdus singularis]MCX2982476.1 sulfate transporter CysZ [Candidatus Litorirhabdus singularis]